MISSILLDRLKFFTLKREKKNLLIPWFWMETLIKNCIALNLKTSNTKCITKWKLAHVYANRCTYMWAKETLHWEVIPLLTNIIDSMRKNDLGSLPILKTHFSIFGVTAITSCFDHVLFSPPSNTWQFSGLILKKLKSVYRKAFPGLMETCFEF